MTALVRIGRQGRNFDPILTQVGDNIIPVPVRTAVSVISLSPSLAVSMPALMVSAAKEHLVEARDAARMWKLNWH